MKKHEINEIIRQIKEFQTMQEEIKAELEVFRMLLQTGSAAG